ncbi:MAG: hypothetical protein GF315_12175 [candidate division Zixibacteria bacterium]|nr:hypothetical protein [candidate division Zixibacteria bacterium]
MRVNFRNLLTNVIVLLITTIIVLLVGEFICHRFIGKKLAEYVEHQPAMLKPADNPELGYVMISNYEDSCYETNSAGFRDQEHSLEKPEGVKRIVMLGNSIGFGLWVCEFDSIFANLLEDELNRREDGIVYELINLCIPGYNSKMQLAMLKEVGVKYDPDLVITAFCINDFHQQPKLRQEGGNYIWRTGGRGTKASRSILNESCLFTTVRSFYSSLLADKLDYSRMDYGNIVDAPRWQRMLDVLTETDTYCEDYGCDYVVVIFPAGNQFGRFARGTAFQESLKSHFNSHDIAYIDLYDTFEQTGLGPKELFIWGVRDEHPTIFGNRISAEMTLEYLSNSDLLR